MNTTVIPFIVEAILAAIIVILAVKLRSAKKTSRLRLLKFDLLNKLVHHTPDNDLLFIHLISDMSFRDILDLKSEIISYYKKNQTASTHGFCLSQINLLNQELDKNKKEFLSECMGTAIFNSPSEYLNNILTEGIKTSTGRDQSTEQSKMNKVGMDFILGTVRDSYRTFAGFTPQSLKCLHDSIDLLLKDENIDADRKKLIEAELIKVDRSFNS